MFHTCIFESLAGHPRDGLEAVSYYKKHWRQIDLVILEMVMPQMGGRETFQRMKGTNPAVRAILSSGYSINGDAQTILNDGVRAFLQKPFQRTELSRVIAEALAG